MTVFRLLRRRLALATATRPTVRAWAVAAGVLLAFAAVAVPFGFASGLLTFTPTGGWGRLAVFALVAVLVPCLAEELVFRVLLLPHPSEGRRPALPATLSVVLFVAWHPLNAALFLPQFWPLFSDWRFLALATLLGVCLTVAYLRGGSVWPCVVVHWLVVVGWNGCLGGPINRMG